MASKYRAFRRSINRLMHYSVRKALIMGNAYYCVKINSLGKKKLGFFNSKVLHLKHR